MVKIRTLAPLVTLALWCGAASALRRPLPQMVAVTRRAALSGGLSAVAAAAVARPASAGAAPAGEPVVSADELAYWRAKLPKAQYRILFGRGTEPAFSSPLVKEKRRGTFACAACGTSLFASSTKFDSGTGWPSFYDALDGVQPVSDNRAVWALIGSEVHCAKCKGHLGDLFMDGYLWQTPTALRYCIDGLALSFEPAPAAA
ncbi:hypothetical protein KFE25_009541 [Diacronema lutheri]|uniref:MsrB domain-containing protein n=2 Tax=Diacronema lutheri TaxID=2081491 RepID=A0A8J5XZZ2_DIALT|nr:hypothetical protein KFE25_009541 [Diacronema lutheri]